MAANPPDFSQLPNERKLDISHSLPTAFSEDYEFMSNLQFLARAQKDFFDNDPEKQKISIDSLLTISSKYGFGKNSIPSNFFHRLKSIIFDNESKLYVIEAALSLTESLIQLSPWTIPIFLELDFPSLLFEYLKSDLLGVPLSSIAFVLNALIYNTEESYQALIQLDYLSYLIEASKPPFEISKAVWVLGSIETIISSPFFDRFDCFHDIVEMSLVYFDLADKNQTHYPMTLVYLLFSRLLASYEQLTEEDFVSITTDLIIERAFEILQQNAIPNISSVFFYINNYIYSHNENSHKIITMGFLELSFNIFKVCELEHQILILSILDNLAKDSVENAVAVLKSPLVVEYLPLILINGNLVLKKKSVFLILTLIKRFRIEGTESESSNLIYQLIIKVFHSIIDMLESEDIEMINYTLQVIHYLTSQMALLDKSQIKDALSMFDENARDALCGICYGEYNETTRSLAQNTIISIEKLFE